MDPRSSNPCCSRVNCTTQPIYGRVYWTQRIKTQWEYNGKEPRKKTWTPCREKELALQPTLGSSLWTSAINTPSFCVFTFLSVTRNCSIFSSVLCQFFLLELLLAQTVSCHVTVWLGPFAILMLVYDILSNFNFSSHWISQIKIFKRIKLAQFVFPQRRPWGKELSSVPLQSTQPAQGQERGGRSYGPHSARSSAGPVSRATSPEGAVKYRISRCHEWQFGYKASE